VVDAARRDDEADVERLLSMPLGARDRCTPDLLEAVLFAAVSGGHAGMAALALRDERLGPFDNFALIAAAAEISDEDRGHRVLDVVLPRVDPNTLKTWTLWDEVQGRFNDAYDRELAWRDDFKRGSSPLYHALESGALWLFDRLLADPRVDPSLTNRLDERAPLLLATLHGDVERVRALIRRGARVDVVELHGLEVDAVELDDAFQPAATYDGPRRGRVYKTGASGPGYYKDGKILGDLSVDELALSLCREAVFLAYERAGWLGDRRARQDRRMRYFHVSTAAFCEIRPSDAIVHPIQLRGLCKFAHEEYTYIMNEYWENEGAMGFASGQFLAVDYQLAGDAALSRREFELVFAHASGRSACARLVRAARAWNAFGGWVALRALLERSRSGAPRTLVEVACGHRPFKTVLSYLSLPTGVSPRNDARLWKCPEPLARLQARPTPDGGVACIDLNVRSLRY